MAEHWAKGLGRTVHGPNRNAKVHGEIPGYPIGSTFKDRMECSRAGVHAPLRAGIHGTAKDGAFSVVLSHGYEDDNDMGDIFEYSGHGGRDTKVKWGGRQHADQAWVLGNKALRISCTTRNPVRVIRGAVKNKNYYSEYAPLEGYRYDGLYVVEKAWKAVGKSGFQTCMFTFRRLPNQLHIGTSASPTPVAELSRAATPKLELPRSERNMYRPFSLQYGFGKRYRDESESQSDSSDDGQWSQASESDRKRGRSMISSDYSGLVLI